MNNRNRPLIEKFRSIVEHRQMAKVNGIRVDLFTASAIVAVHDAISPEAQAKLMSLPIPKIAAIAFQLLK